MGEGMEVKPPKLWESLLRRLLPPASREHVLGDLNERFCAARGAYASRQYAKDALFMAPAMIWSQVRRAANPMLLSATAVFIYVSLIAAVFLGPGDAFAFFGEQNGLLRLAVVALASVAGLALAD